MINKISAFFYSKRIKNKDFTIIARDCVGGLIYHQFKLRFLTPTINLCFNLEDFNNLCLNLKDYMSGELKELKDDKVNYPVGLLYPVKTSKINKPIRIEFMHYDSFEIAKEKWLDRASRINYDNIYVVSSCCYSTEIDTLNQEIIDNWNKITYKKVILVNKAYGFNDEYIIDKPKKCQEFAWLLYSPSKLIKWKKTFNKFDFVKFLNDKGGKK